MTGIGGFTGMTRITGMTGITGITGITLITGISGITGIGGFTGITGITGMTGITDNLKNGKLLTHWLTDNFKSRDASTSKKQIYTCHSMVDSKGRVQIIKMEI